MNPWVNSSKVCPSPPLCAYLWMELLRPKRHVRELKKPALWAASCTLSENARAFLSSLNLEANICEILTLMAVALRSPIIDRPRRLPQHGQMYCLLSFDPPVFKASGIAISIVFSPHEGHSLWEPSPICSCIQFGQSRAAVMP